ncbi:hypothetical protein LZ30DRAFT_202955 [Colletotrichum cereale]|nr:hypothetical protein LZ30DRAFT_202955 [Colletotrichum cereale]
MMLSICRAWLRMTMIRRHLATVTAWNRQARAGSKLAGRPLAEVLAGLADSTARTKTYIVYSHFTFDQHPATELISAARSPNGKKCLFACSLGTHVSLAGLGRMRRRDVRKSDGGWRGGW